MALEPLTVLLSAALLVVSVLYLYKFSAKRRRFVKMVNKLPGPPTLPLLGNARDVMVPRNQFMGVVNRHYDMHKPIYRTWTGPVGEVHITLPEHIEKIIGGMANIEKAFIYTLLHPWLGQGLLTSTGAKWHARRKLITPTFHFSILEAFCDVFVDKSKILVDKLRLAMEEHGGEAFDVYPFVTRCALDIICETAMGTEINAQEQTHSEYVRAVNDISGLTMRRALSPWLFPDFIFSRTAIGRRHDDCLKVLHGFTDKVIKERTAENSKASERAYNNANEDEGVLGKKKRMAFLDLLLKASEGDNRLSDTEIREEVDTFMFEGHDTTTAGISWALLLLGAYPDVQAKAYEELESIFHDSDRPITMRDLQEMKYLERVIKETLRLYPSVPFIMRTLDEDTECGGYMLPKGVLLNIHIFHVHRNPDLFPDPEHFDPDRFLPERVQGRHPYAYIPFSAGPRNCIGQKFALLEEKTVLASVLRHFRLRSVEGREGVTLIGELILKPEEGVKLVLTPRGRGRGGGNGGVTKSDRVYY